jgi:multidrug efflux pump subunit AcrA (membrane-fusion protein)
LFIEVNIEEAEINKLSSNQKVYATFDALDELELEGTISFMSLTSKTSNGIVTYLVRIVIIDKGDNKIREGMTASVEFVTAEATDVLIIPVASVRNINGEPSVELKDGEIKTVVTGFTDGKNVEIISGLNEGDTVIY